LFDNVLYYLKLSTCTSTWFPTTGYKIRSSLSLRLQPATRDITKAH